MKDSVDLHVELIGVGREYALRIQSEILAGLVCDDVKINIVSHAVPQPPPDRLGRSGRMW